MDTTPSKLKFSQECGSPNSRLMNSPAASCVNSSASSKRSLFRCARQLSFSSAVDDSYQEAEPALSGDRKPQEPTLIVKAPIVVRLERCSLGFSLQGYRG